MVKTDTESKYIRFHDVTWQNNRKQFHNINKSKKKKKRILLEPELKFGYTDLDLKYRTFKTNITETSSV